MGVTLERVQNKFACIIGELCSEPVVLSQFAIWLDLRLAEYKAKGAISLDCSGDNPDPVWLNGHRMPHKRSSSRDRRYGTGSPGTQPGEMSWSRISAERNSQSPGYDRTEPVVGESLSPAAVKTEPLDHGGLGAYPVSLHPHEIPDSRTPPRKRSAAETISGEHELLSSGAKSRRLSQDPNSTADPSSNQSLMSIISGDVQDQDPETVDLTDSDMSMIMNYEDRQSTSQTSRGENSRPSYTSTPSAAAGSEFAARSDESLNTAPKWSDWTGGLQSHVSGQIGSSVQTTPTDMTSSSSYASAGLAVSTSSLALLASTSSLALNPMPASTVSRSPYGYMPSDDGRDNPNSLAAWSEMLSAVSRRPYPPPPSDFRRDAIAPLPSLFEVPSLPERRSTCSSTKVEGEDTDMPRDLSLPSPWSETPSAPSSAVPARRSSSSSQSLGDIKMDASVALLMMSAQQESAQLFSDEDKLWCSTVKPIMYPTTYPETLRNQNIRARIVDGGGKPQQTIVDMVTAVATVERWMWKKHSETRSIETMPPAALDQYLAEFYPILRRPNGKEYDPKSLTNFKSRLDRFLKENHYPCSINKSDLFTASQQAFASKRRAIIAKRSQLQRKPPNTPPASD